MMEGLLRPQRLLTDEVLRNPQLLIDTSELQRQKVTHLRSIDSEICNNSVSDAILDSLEKLEQIYRHEKIEITEWMKDAYRAVVIYCALRSLPENFQEGNGNSQAVERVLGGRVSKLEMLNSEFLSDLSVCKEAFRVLLSNSDALNKWKERSAEHKDYALALTRFFVSGAMSDIDPAFVENNGIRIDKEAKEDKIRVGSQQLTTEKAATSGEAEAREKKDARASNEKVGSTEGKDKECRTEGVEFKKESRGEMLPNKPAAPRKHYKGPARIVYTEDLDSEIVSSMSTSNVKQAAVKAAAGKPSTDDSLEIRLASPKGKDGDDSLHIRLESPKGKDGDDSLRIRLESPKRKVTSPLKIYEDAKFTKRRKNKIWTPEEEDALREGVKKHGKGNWKVILNSNRDVFSERQEVDLKDKWRNLTKWGETSRRGFPP